MTDQSKIQELEKTASQVRRDVLRMIHACQSGHPGASVGCADYMVALYFELMEYSVPFNKEGKNEDIFFLSNGHISAVWYSVLARKGFFPVDELKTFRQMNSRLQGHPATEEGLPGIRIASGSLGQGLSVAIGNAQVKKLNGDKKSVHVLMGDGEQQEGQVWEAAMYAAHNNVDNLIASIDYNGRQIDGDVDDVLSLKDLKAKYEAFGWKVIESDGNSMQDIVEKLHLAQSLTGNGKPILNLMRTEMGHPIDFMVGTHKWHGVSPNDDQLENALGQLEETLGDY